MMSNQEILTDAELIDYLFSYDPRVHIIAKGAFGKKVMENMTLPESKTLSVEFLEGQQISEYESKKINLLLVISDDFDWQYVQNYQNVDVQMIIGSRPYRGLIKPHSCFVYGQPIEQYQAMIRSILNIFFDQGLVSMEFRDLKKLTEKGGTGVITSSFQGGDADSHRAKKAAEAAVAQLKAESTNLSQIQGCLISIVAGFDLELMEVDMVTSTFMKTMDPEAIVLFGTELNEDLEGVGIQVNALAIM